MDDAARAALLRHYQQIDARMSRTPVHMTEREIREVSHGRLACLFGLFLRPVPDGTEFPCVWSTGYTYTILTGEFGYRIEFPCAQGPRAPAVYPYFHGEPADAHPVRGSTHCDNDSSVAPWLRSLVRDFGLAMVLRAHLVACTHTLSRQIRVAGLPDVGACALPFRVRGAWFVHVSAADGVSVPVGADAVGSIARPDQLSPWTRALLARPDAHALLVRIVCDADGMDP